MRLGKLGPDTASTPTTCAPLLPRVNRKPSPSARNALDLGPCSKCSAWGTTDSKSVRQEHSTHALRSASAMGEWILLPSRRLKPCIVLQIEGGLFDKHALSGMLKAPLTGELNSRRKSGAARLSGIISDTAQCNGKRGRRTMKRQEKGAR